MHLLKKSRIVGQIFTALAAMEVAMNDFQTKY